MFIKLDIIWFVARLFLDNPFVTKICLGITKIFFGSDHITIERWSKVIESVFGDIVPFGLGGFGSEDPVVS